MGPAALEAAEAARQETSEGVQASHAQDQALGAEASTAAEAGSSHMSGFASASLASLQGLESELAPGLSTRLQPPPSGGLQKCRKQGTEIAFLGGVWRPGSQLSISLHLTSFF